MSAVDLWPLRNPPCLKFILVILSRLKHPHDFVNPLNMAEVAIDFSFPQSQRQWTYLEPFLNPRSQTTTSLANLLPIRCSVFIVAVIKSPPTCPATILRDAQNGREADRPGEVRF
jgi:hypothetical protein